MVCLVVAFMCEFSHFEKQLEAKTGKINRTIGIALAISWHRFLCRIMRNSRSSWQLQPTNLSPYLVKQSRTHVGLTPGSVQQAYARVCLGMSLLRSLQALDFLLPASRLSVLQIYIMYIVYKKYFG